MGAGQCILQTCYNLCMVSDEFSSLVAHIRWSPVPERFRSLISNVALLIEDEPTLETRQSLDLSEGETLLGLYHGIPRTARGESYGVGMVLPDTITLYRLPILAAAAEDGISVRQVVEDTIWHEVAHHFGLDENEVGRREAERNA